MRNPWIAPFFPIKSFHVNQICQMTMAWKQRGLKSVNSHVLHLLSFPVDTDWETWRIAAQIHSPQEEHVIGRILSENALQCHLQATNPSKQLQCSSFSWVTVVTGSTNPLTHSLDFYLALDSISWVWLGRDKCPLLRLWYPNEWGFKAHSTFDFT